MNAFEYDDGEMALRTRLEDDLGAFAPGLVPAEAILAEGRGIQHRRRRARGVGIASVVAFALAAGVLGHALVGQAAPPSSHPTPAKHHVTVDSTPRDKANGAIGSGTADGVAWEVAHQPGVNGGTFTDHLGPGPAIPVPSYPLSGSPGKQPSLSDPLAQIVSVEQDFGNTAKKFGFYAGEVPRSVSWLVLDLDDGETVTVPAESSLVTATTTEYYVAFVMPSDLGIDKITLYSGTGVELGYSIPFNDSGFPIIASWYAPGQEPTTSAYGNGSTSGSVDGTAWRFSGWTGQFGVCYSFTMLPAYAGTVSCRGQFVPPLQSVAFPAQLAGPGGEVIVYGPVNQSVNKVDLTLSDGRTVEPDLLDLGALTYYVAAYPPGTEITEVATYDAFGDVLARAHG